MNSHQFDFRGVPDESIGAGINASPWGGLSDGVEDEAQVDAGHGRAGGGTRLGEQAPFRDRRGDHAGRSPPAGSDRRALVVQRGGPAAERHRMRVEQCPRLRANVDAEFLRGRGDDTQHFYQLLLSLVAKGAARIPCSPHECR